ncbi:MULTISPECIES: phosphoribosyl-AMP cyclohydrolase [unclassified Oleiphilus]|jgi:phosphoribosyl-AMP cyclohydrolase|uniref:phosphoribosyl-AMP cyclohydrolase n=1 Tax=unclassified Oleiphilus TaxID=2631174 RepID=UPI0007C28D2B|nr:MULTISPECIES: phosphoribosyl-AMP cyclohydrolase [unclassified Oleiphilus]KZY45978.1 phosphoribosyl-AMP cyclohydrolase [Oleiphilus sp. HI0050]KZY83497.1 phosphoribosyl-AMP cyclohydrolase [Oleiphilus sp. HI0068]KZY85208.1 phosphoribosyl-AMP cyclohydrolase [Oleiphilus sp. HI0069]KZY96793.1 phosphoribosyl-AMP cyclohydrolase [Oleiphilus sp. HI0072]KZZ10307.1 phosphoribosyl-AMP cyclohydrolase [Oleiphilus sp. HI0078]KZZ20992.1 phosphoribosyl-AMP cyclohydrolase [Oleiphilus sp. HI0081]KZZ32695.1 p
MKSWFKSIENDAEGTSYPLDKVLNELNFSEEGLIPVIAQDHETREVLMFAWMNRESLKETLETSKMCYWSRSRKSLWRKGESSGHWQSLVSMRTDCDGDVLLALVTQDEAACHTHRRSCFYLKFEQGEVVIAS